jgi:hypothetical protein
MSKRRAFDGVARFSRHKGYKLVQTHMAIHDVALPSLHASDWEWEDENVWPKFERLSAQESPLPPIMYK